MEWKVELETTCSALGTYDGAKYYKDDDCLECVKDLIRFLRRDDDNFVLRRTLGQIGVVKSDLIPLLRDYSNETELFDMTLRLMVNLTSPEILLFREEMPEDKTMRNFYLEMQAFRQGYKRAFVDEKLWAVLTENLGKLLRKDFDQRSEDDRMTIERILILARNILQVPRDVSGENRTDGDVTIHDQVLWVLHKSGMEDMLLFIATSDDEAQYCLHVLEIISLMFREQDPKHLATANFQRSKEEKVEDEMALLKLRNQELEKKKQRFHQLTSARHSRFGGTFIVKNVKSISEKELIYHKPLTAINQLDFNKEKRPMKVSKNRMIPEDVDTKRRSTLSIRLFLKEFCVEFLHGAYNKLMFVVKDYLNRKKAQLNDETYYLWALKFFMEFNRIHKFRVELVTETLSKSTFHYIQQQIEAYKDNYEHEKKNRPMCLMWARRMHLGIKAYQELLLNLVAMNKAEEENVRQSAAILRADVFYEPEYRELCLQQISLYQPEKMSMGYLKDLVETTHVFLKLLENMAKSKHLMVSKKSKRRKKPKTSKNKSGAAAAPGSAQGSREGNEAKWDEISAELSRILQGSADELPNDITPFDAASEVPIDDQKSAAMFRIQHALRQANPAEAIALLRASREVWPENDAFGAADADVEDEFMALREILFANIPKPSHLTGIDEVPNEDQVEGNVVDEDQIDEAEEFEEETGAEEFITYSVEQEFNFREFVMRFATKSVCSAYGLLFSNFERNTDYTNMCIVKMFHRIAFDCDLPALLFHVSIFRTFQKIYRDLKIAPANATLRELAKFAKFLLRKFFEVCPKNPHIFMELCFWKTSREAVEIVDGYGTQSSTARQKASFWCEEDEEKLTRVFHQLKEMEANSSEGRTGDLLDDISAFFIESGKSRRQVARKLKEMELIKDIKEVTKKPLKLRAPREWSETEISELKDLYKEFKDAVDPVNRIIDRMTVKRQKKRVVEKIMELGLCNDKKKLMKKRIRRGLKEGDPGFLEKASESDSALEDSSTDSETESDSDSNGNIEADLDLTRVLKELTSSEDLKPALEWIQSCLADEADDRETEEPDGEGVPILPLTEATMQAMENDSFLKLLKSLQISPPGNEQEQYWRIPGDLTAGVLRTKARYLAQALEGNFDTTNFNVEHLGGSNVGSSSKKKKKKHEKRGPNKWMPMKRQVDDEALARIEMMFPARAKSESTRKSSAEKKTARKNSVAGKRPRARRKLGENEDKENSVKDAVILSPKLKPKKRVSTFLDSSDDEEGSTSKALTDSESNREPSKISKSFIESSEDSESDNDKSKSKARVLSSSESDREPTKISRSFVETSDSDSDAPRPSTGNGLTRSPSQSINTSRRRIGSSSSSRSSSPISSVLDTPSSRVSSVLTSSRNQTPASKFASHNSTPKRGRVTSASGSDSDTLTVLKKKSSKKQKVDSGSDSEGETPVKAKGKPKRVVLSDSE